MDWLEIIHANGKKNIFLKFHYSYNRHCRTNLYKLNKGKIRTYLVIVMWHQIIEMLASLTLIEVLVFGTYGIPFLLNNIDWVFLTGAS